MWDIGDRDWKVNSEQKQNNSFIFWSCQGSKAAQNVKTSLKYFSDARWWNERNLDFTPKIIWNLWISDFHGRLMIAIAQTRLNLWEGAWRNLSTRLLSSPSVRWEGNLPKIIWNLWISNSSYKIRWQLSLNQCVHTVWKWEKLSPTQQQLCRIEFLSARARSWRSLWKVRSQWSVKVEEKLLTNGSFISPAPPPLHMQQLQMLLKGNWESTTFVKVLGEQSKHPRCCCCSFVDQMSPVATGGESFSNRWPTFEKISVW